MAVVAVMCRAVLLPESSASFLRLRAIIGIFIRLPRLIIILAIGTDPAQTAFETAFAIGTDTVYENATP